MNAKTKLKKFLDDRKSLENKRNGDGKTNKDNELFSAFKPEVCYYMPDEDYCQDDKENNGSNKEN